MLRVYCISVLVEANVPFNIILHFNIFTVTHKLVLSRNKHWIILFKIKIMFYMKKVWHHIYFLSLFTALEPQCYRLMH